MYKSIMDEIGNPVVFNICMLGALLGLTEIIKPASVIEVLSLRVPSDFLDINKKALKIGLAKAKETR